MSKSATSIAAGHDRAPGLRAWSKRNCMALSWAGLLATSCLFGAPAFAQSVSGSAREPARAAADVAPNISGAAIFIDKRAPAAARAAATSALSSKASAQGVVRVIAGVNVNLKASHELSEAQSAGQQQALSAAQSSVVTRVLGPGASGASVTNFEHIPFVAMNVTAGQLNRLVADPDVVSIQEDVAVPPNLTQSVPFINANDVWAAGFQGSGFAVAILDTGVDKTHDMFRAARSRPRRAIRRRFPVRAHRSAPGAPVHRSRPGRA